MFIVTKRFGRSETRAGNFNREVEAEKFIQDKLREDIRFKINATYGLYEGADLLREFNQSDAITDTTDSSQSSDDSSGGGRTSGSSFRPTPLNTAPRPGGMPSSWIKDEESKEK